MQNNVAQIAQKLNGAVIGDGEVQITSLNGLQDAQAGDLSFLGNPSYTSVMKTTQASAVLVQSDYTGEHDFPVIQVENPYLAFATLLSELEQELLIHPTGIHPTATRGANVTIGENCAIDANVHIADNAGIADNVILYAGVYLGRNSTIGPDTIVYPNTTIRENVTVGKNCIIHSNVAIGSDGFGFTTIDGIQAKIPQIGKVIIGDNVEVGSNSAIDRATFGVTRIGNGTKIDNLVQIAHNVTIGENGTISGGSAIAGSATLGNNVTMGGNSGIIGHVTIGDNVILGAGAGALQPLEEGAVVSGFPAIDHKTNLRMIMSQRRLHKALRTIRDLEKRIEELEQKLNG